MFKLLNEQNQENQYASDIVFDFSIENVVQRNIFTYHENKLS